jgi:drug/metabolite transporter (DMT)-like permease
VYILTAPGEGLAINIGNVVTLASSATWSFQVALLSRAGTEGCRTKLMVLFPVLVMLTLSCVWNAASGGFTLQGVDVAAAVTPLIMCAIFATIVACATQAYAQRFISPNKAAVIFTLESVFATAISALMGYEHLTPMFFLGGGLVLSAIILGEFLGRRVPESEPTSTGEVKL